MFSQSLIKIVKPLTTDRILPIVALVFLGFFFLLTYLDNELKAIGGGSGVLDLQFAFTLERGTEIIRQWGTIGRHLALTGLLIDCFYPISYGLLLMTLIVRIFNAENSEGSANRLLYLPLWAVILDYAENIVHWRAIESFPAVSTFSFFIASLFATTKWMLVVITILAILSAWVRGNFPIKLFERGR